MSKLYQQILDLSTMIEEQRQCKMYSYLLVGFETGASQKTPQIQSTMLLKFVFISWYFCLYLLNIFPNCHSIFKIYSNMLRTFILVNTVSTIGYLLKSINKCWLIKWKIKNCWLRKLILRKKVRRRKYGCIMSFVKREKKKEIWKVWLKKHKWDKVFSKWSLISDDLYQQYQRQKIWK